MGISNPAEILEKKILMQSTKWIMISAFAVLWGFLPCGSHARTWTTQSGQTLEAEFMRLLGDKVYLKASDGSGQRSVPFGILSEKDKKVVRELAGSSSPRKMGERKLGERSQFDDRPKFGERSQFGDRPKFGERALPKPSNARVIPGSQADKANQAIAAWREKKAVEEEERRKKLEESKKRFEEQKKERARQNSSKKRRR